MPLFIIQGLLNTPSLGLYSSKNRLKTCERFVLLNPRILMWGARLTALLLFYRMRRLTLISLEWIHIRLWFSNVVSCLSSVFSFLFYFYIFALLFFYCKFLASSLQAFEHPVKNVSNFLMFTINKWKNLVFKNIFRQLQNSVE